jgi:tetratricopeptide (TPR) repeat protein
MKLIRDLLIAITFALAIPLTAHAGASMLRVACEDYDAGAEVFVNGKFKGECPIDFQVAPGTNKLRVVKKIDNEYERVFQQDFRIGDGVVKKIEPRLIRELTETGKKRLNATLDKIINDANKGETFAQFQLYKRYSTGEGVAKDKVEAIKWARKAAEQGYAPAQYLIGLTFSMSGTQYLVQNDNKSAEANYKEAMDWYLKAANQDYEDAKKNVGFLYSVGAGVSKNCEEAARWYREAAELGSFNAMSDLAHFYLGDCDKKYVDREESDKWLSKLVSYQSYFKMKQNK